MVLEQDSMIPSADGIEYNGSGGLVSKIWMSTKDVDVRLTHYFLYGWPTSDSGMRFPNLGELRQYRVSVGCS